MYSHHPLNTNVHKSIKGMNDLTDIAGLAVWNTFAMLKNSLSGIQCTSTDFNKRCVRASSKVEMEFEMELMSSVPDDHLLSS